MIILPLPFYCVCLISLSHLIGISYLTMLNNSVIQRTFRKFIVCQATNKILVNFKEWKLYKQHPLIIIRQKLWCQQYNKQKNLFYLELRRILLNNPEGKQNLQDEFTQLLENKMDWKHISTDGICKSNYPGKMYSINVT